MLALEELAARRRPASDAHRRARNLWDFALEGHIGQLTKRVEEELAGANWRSR